MHKINMPPNLLLVVQTLHWWLGNRTGGTCIFVWHFFTILHYCYFTVWTTTDQLIMINITITTLQL